MKHYVITMMDLSESVQVANRCIRSGEKFGLNIEKFKAVTPKDNPYEILRSEGIPSRGILTNVSRPEPVLSCFLSHYMLWKKCIELDEEITIFEHDAVIMDKIPDDLNYKGCINFGQPSWGNYKIPEIGIHKLSSMNCFPGAHAYRIKPIAAKVIVRDAKIKAQPADEFLNNSNFDFLEEYYPWPVKCQDNFTTVQKINGTRGKINYKKIGNDYKII